MSWIFGIVRKNEKKLLPHKANFPFYNKEKFVVETEEYYFSCGIGHNNSFFKYEKEKEAGWIVCGTGISYEKGSFHLMDFKRWEDFLGNKNNDVNDLNGHFIIVEWSKGTLRFRNDQLGMRDMFFAETENYFSFSTRLDWILPYTNDPKIDFRTYGSIWFYINSFSYNCFVKNVKRLGQRGEATIIHKRLYITNRPWLPKYAKGIKQISIGDLIKKFCTIGIDRKRVLELGLSGGLDSRILLSILLKANAETWQTYTYGDSQFPDVIIAKKLADRLGFKHEIVKISLSKNEELKKFETFVLETNGFVNGYFFYEQDHYHDLSNNNLLIDGGKGAFCRRNHAKYLWLKGTKHIADRNPEGILKHITLNKPTIFNQETCDSMNSGSIEEMNDVISSMPRLSEIGTGNWVDIFTVRYHCANAGSPTQNRLDNIIGNYMPLLQPSFLRRLFGLPVNFRAKNRIYKSLLAKSNPLLGQIPLVKDMSIVPFTTNTFLTFILGKILERLQKCRTVDYAQIFLSNNKDFVLDTLKSREVKEYPHYDYGKIHALVEGYFKGREDYARSVLWWLTFDVWRRKLQEKRKNLIMD